MKVDQLLWGEHELSVIKNSVLRRKFIIRKETTESRIILCSGVS
jgi:hypothetical protein